jgi:glycosyltransferase involved in cell wall biosynthesis
MKICIVTHEFSPQTGQGKVNYEIAQYLLDRGHEVFMIASDVASNLASYPNAHVFLVKIPAWVKSALFRAQFFAVRSATILKDNHHKFDIIHANGSITYYPSDVNACHFVHSSWQISRYHPIRNKIGLNSLYQSFYTILNAKWEQSSYQKTDRVIAVSEFVKQSLVRDAHVPSDTIDVVWNGVDIEEFRPQRPDEENHLRKSLGLPTAACISFFTGDLKTNRKNLDLVLQALVQLPKYHHLVVAGGVEGSIYPEMARELGIADRVHFLGYRSDVSSLLRYADVFTFPSHYDPCPLVLLEALACGVPVITARSVGNSASLEHGKNGYVLESSYDLDIFVKILRQLGESTELRRRVGQAGRRTAEELSWQKMAAHYETIYAMELNRRDRDKVYPSNYAMARRLE